MLKRVTLVLLVLLGMAAPIGRGDDGPSREEFVADLDAICKETRARVAEVDAPLTIGEIPRYTRESRRVVDDSLDKAEDLELPAEDRERFESYIRDSRRSVAALDELERAARRKDRKGVRRIVARVAEDNSRRDAEARRLGLKQCGNPSRG